MSSASGDEKFVSDPYEDWPYADAYLFRTLDPDLIESHANQILSRALNIGRVIAFVGAGASMSYGRISWRGLVDAEVQLVHSRFDEFIKRIADRIGKEKESEEVQKNAVLARPEYRHIRRLWDALESLDLQSGREVRGDRFPMMFQLCEQLDSALKQVESQNSFESDPNDSLSRLRRHAMALTIDDRGHARQILLDALVDRADVKEDAEQRGELLNLELMLAEDTAKDFVPELSKECKEALTRAFVESPKQTQNQKSAYRSIYQVKAMGELLAQVAPSRRCGKLLDAIERIVGESAGKSEYLLPTQRYVIGVLLRLFPLGQRRTLGWWTARNEGAETSASDRVSRHDLIKQQRDPLFILNDKLGINRYITTNYDHEIERLLRDRGFRGEYRGSKIVAAPNEMPEFKSIVFDNKHASSLVAFAAQNRSRTPSIVHLHGRSEDHPTGGQDIIVTEEDYQARYLRVDGTRPLVDDAIRLAFGGNPILFVGSNMGEDDILRPLREFMSNSSRAGDRMAVALVPASHELSKRTEDKVALLGRYGVYAIHFGSAGVRPPTRGASIGDVRAGQADWLHWVWKIKKTLGEGLESFRTNGGDLNDKCIGKLRDAISKAKEGIEKLHEGPELSRDVEKRLANVPGGSDAFRSQFIESDRRGNLELAVPCVIEGIFVDRDSDLRLDVDVGVINACIKWLRIVGEEDPFDALRQLPEESRLRELKQLRSEARALNIALDGASDSIMATFTCARLAAVRWDWDNWKERWFALPAARMPHDYADQIDPETFGRPSLVTQGAKVVRRHAIAIEVCPAPEPRQSRFYAGAPSQTFYGLIEALRLNPAPGNVAANRNIEAVRNANGRRILLLVSKRGLGKGQFFSALGDCHGAKGEDACEPRLLEFLRALSPTNGSFPKWNGAAFFNLSFAHEVSSVFDRLSTFLLDRLPEELKGEGKRIFDSLKRDRIGRLRAMLQRWTLIEDTNTTRLLVAMNSVGILFDRYGRAKNGQVKHIFDLLFSNEFASAPIDFVFICQDAYIPAPFRFDTKPARWDVKFLSGTGLSVKDELALRQQLVELRLAAPVGEASTAVAPSVELAWKSLDTQHLPDKSWRSVQIGRVSVPALPPSKSERTQIVAVHILRKPRASIFVSSYFPRIGLLLARHHLFERTYFAKYRKTEKNPKYVNIFEDHSAEFRDSMRKALNRLNRDRRIQPRLAIPAVTVALAFLLETDRIGRNELEKKLVSIINEISDAQASQPDIGHGAGDSEFERTVARIVQIVKKDCGIAEEEPGEFSGEFLEVVKAYDRRLRQIYNAVGGGRYLLTLLFASAYEVTTALSVSETQGFRDFDEIEKATTDVDRVLERAVLALQAVPTDSLPDVVIGLVLDIIHRHHDRGANMPLSLRLGGFTPEGPDEEPQIPPKKRIYSEGRKATPEIYRLMTEVIWHLAIIGRPVEADVIAWCPRVRAACDELKRSVRPKDEFALGKPDYEHCVKEALVLAVNRCLVFELRQRVHQGDENSSIKQSRYSLHALLQRDIFKKLGAPDAEFTAADQFTLSQYASQPDDLPRLSNPAHQEISAAIAALAGYPGEAARAETHSALCPFYRKRLLRAAFGIMRSVYSIAVLARFEHHSGSDDGRMGQEGYFEEYRRLVRWLIQVAMDLPKTKTCAVPDEKSCKLPTPKPLPQSDCVGPNDPTADNRDAAPGLGGDLAPFYAEEIVWLFNECGVLSLVQGKLADAHALFVMALKAAKEIEPNESGALHVRILLNKSVVDIERGHGFEARKSLEKIERISNEHPVPSVLAKGYLALIDHLAGEIELAKKRYIDAISELTRLHRTRAASIFSRHYGDLLRNVSEGPSEESKQHLMNAIHFAQEGGHEDVRHLALLSLMGYQSQHSETAQMGDIHHQLDGIERYARVVGMPRALCEVRHIRARLLLMQGETHLAGSLATESLEIAAINDLRLEKVTGLLLLAEINMKRNQTDAARPLLSLGKKMAKEASHHFALTRAQNFEHALGIAK